MSTAFAFRLSSKPRSSRPAIDRRAFSRATVWHFGKPRLKLRFQLPKPIFAARHLPCCSVFLRRPHQLFSSSMTESENGLGRLSALSPVTLSTPLVVGRLRLRQSLLQRDDERAAAAMSVSSRACSA